MRSIDLIIFIVYLSGITVFGSSFFKKNRSASSFTLGNKDIPAWVISLSIFATFVSSISFLALPGNAYLSNWSAFVFSLSIPVSLWIAIRYFVPVYRKVNSPSAYTFLEMRFGPWSRVYVSAFYLLTQIMRIGTILYLLALTLHTITGWNIVIIISVTGLAVMLYSVLGGFEAVVWTDAIQAIILISGALITALYILFHMPQGPSQLFSIAFKNDKFSLGSFSLNFRETTFWVVLVYGLFINLQNYGIDQNYVQRYMASKTDKQAKSSAFWGGIIYVPVSMVFLFIGTALFSYYRSGALALPAGLQGTGSADKIFPYFIVNSLPTGITGLLIASIFAAGMSTIATSFNSAATVFLTDYYARYSRKPLSENNSMKVLYASTTIISALGITIAIGMINVRSALDTWWELASVFSGGMLGIFLLAAFSRITGSAGAIVGAIAGLLVILWLSLAPILFKGGIGSSMPNSYLTIALATTTIFFVGFFTSLLFGNKRQNRAARESRAIQ